MNHESKSAVKTHLIDIAIAHFMIRRLFKTTLDELPAQTRRFLNQVVSYILKIAKDKNQDPTHIWL